MCSLTTALVVLHTDQSVTLAAYLFRVFVFLVAFAYIGAIIFGGTLSVETLIQRAAGADGINENEP